MFEVILMPEKLGEKIMSAAVFSEKPLKVGEKRKKKPVKLVAPVVKKKKSKKKKK